MYIRNYDLYKELIKEKFNYKGENYTLQNIDRIALKENELLIDEITSKMSITEIAKKHNRSELSIKQKMIKFNKKNNTQSSPTFNSNLLNIKCNFIE